MSFLYALAIALAKSYDRGLMTKLCLGVACVLFTIVTACTGGPTPTPLALTSAPINPQVVAVTPNAAATETAVAARIFSTLTASAPQGGASNDSSMSGTATSAPKEPTLAPPTQAPPPATAIPVASPVATIPPPTISRQLSPSITPVLLVPTAVPSNSPANPTQATAPTRVPVQAAVQISREALRGKILFRSTRNGGGYYIINSDGSGRDQLPNEPARNLYLSLKPLEGYSPDRKLVVVGEQTCYVLNTCHLYIGEPNVVLSRSQGQWITSKNGERADNPVWSPDGSWIAFIWNRGTDKTKNIYKGLWAEQNQDFKRLTAFYAGKDTKDPTYSPDGSLLAFSTQDGPHWQIWVLDATAESCQKRGGEESCPSNPHNITNSQFDETDPIWIK